MTLTDVSSRELAAALAARLSAIVPRGFSVRSDGTNLKVYLNGELVGGSAALEIIEDDDDRSVEERIEDAVGGVLSAIQDGSG